MQSGYDGRQVVGMDLHRRRSVLVRMSEDGRRLGMTRITNSPAALRKEIARAGKNPRVVLEAAYGWYWAADTLAAAGAEVHLAHPLGVKAFTYRRVKNDERDAADLADLLRMGRLPEAWIAPVPTQNSSQCGELGILSVRETAAAVMREAGRPSGGATVGEMVAWVRQASRSCSSDCCISSSAR